MTFPDLATQRNPAHTPLPSKALYEAVSERLRERIFSGELVPGDWLDEQKLALELGISRTPMREAIKVLAAEGLVTMKMRRGAYVTELSRTDLEQVFHLLALLESDACASLAQSIQPAQLSELETRHQQLCAAAQTDREQFFKHNESFHFALLDFANNRWRSQMVQDLRKVMKLHRHHSLFTAGRVENSVREHEAIMQALRQGDASSAQTAMRKHIQNGQIAAERSSNTPVPDPA